MGEDQAERRLLLGEAWHDAGVVVDRGDGRPLDPAELSHGFARLCARNGFEGVRLHDLRHAFATELLVAGVHPKVVSDALGHASTAFTMDVYSHVLPAMGEQVAQAMQQALAGTPRGQGCRGTGPRFAVLGGVRGLRVGSVLTEQHRDSRAVVRSRVRLCLLEASGVRSGHLREPPR